MNQVGIINLLKEQYSIKAETLELVREGGSTAYVVMAGSRKYFLRIVHPAFFDTAAAAVDIQYFLQNQGFSVPHILPTDDGSPCMQWHSEDKKRLLVLYEYIEGTECEPDQDAEAIGELLGKLHKAMKHYPGPLVKHDKPFFIGRYIDILRRKQYPKADEFEAYGDTIWERVKFLPRGYCHGDTYRGNIHKTPDGKLYMLDFDTSCEALPVYDPVLICNRTHYFEFDPEGYDKSKAVFERFLPSYLKHSPLSQAEIDAFFDLIAVYHFQVQATVIEINGLDCVDAAFFDRQYDWLCRWREQCESKKPNPVIQHYDALIEENNDPVHDPAPLRAYMDKWDGEPFMNALELSPEKTVLEIGVGTGRLAVQIAPKCKSFWGIDLSPKTIDRAKENLIAFKNVTLFCNDFLMYSFSERFDVIYSSLTLMHIEDKSAAVQKAADLLKTGGKLVISIDKNQSDRLEYNGRMLKLYPDNPEQLYAFIKAAGLSLGQVIETEFAYIITAVKG